MKHEHSNVYIVKEKSSNIIRDNLFSNFFHKVNSGMLNYKSSCVDYTN
jgi:hypothetical protein